MTRIPLAGLIAATLLAASFSAAADLAEARRLADQGRNDAALSAVEHHLREQPEDVAGRFLHARLLAATGHQQEAIRLYRRLADELPHNPEPRNNLAALYAARGEVERARQALLEALATHPSYATAFDNLQTLHARLASIAYRRALGGDDNDGGSSEPLHLTALPAIHDLPHRPPALVAARIPEGTPTPVATPSPQRQPPSNGEEGTIESIRRTVQAWAVAWSAKDVKGYLAHYAGNYRPEELTHAEWSAQRRVRLNKPRHIQVTLKKLQVRLTGPDSAEAVFEQSYNADSYADRVIKQLTLRRSADGWKIVVEQTLSVLG
ncbi:L,D-transpeptidase Cds6 family protein [Endothiovibrio diazotrophicus]